MQQGRDVMAGLKADRELGTRTLSGAAVVILVLIGIYMGGFVWTVIASVIALCSLSEYYKILSGYMRKSDPEKFRKRSSELSPGIGYIFSLAILISAMKGARPLIIAILLTLGVFAIFIREILRKQLTHGNESYAISNAAGILSGVIYISIPWVCMIVLRNYDYGSQILMTLFACTWGCDVAAYLGGRAFGISKLCKYVSPGKTWAGFVSGLLGSMLINALALYLLTLPVYPLLFVGIICGIAGQAGDLAESLIKREADIKDSGNLIPGHGGFLDRFDSILINGALTYLLLGVTVF